MSENKIKTYVNGVSVKEKVFDNGSLLRMGISVDKVVEFLKANKNSGGYVNLIISPRKEVGQYGDTHSVYLDTWEPNKKSAPVASQKPSSSKSKQNATPAESDQTDF
jgi:hypothetical protein